MGRWARRSGGELVRKVTVQGIEAVARKFVVAGKMNKCYHVGQV